MSWNDFNTADDQNSYDLIPKGTLARVRMTIRPGGFSDDAQGWTGHFRHGTDPVPPAKASFCPKSTPALKLYPLYLLLFQEIIRLSAKQTF